jgi:hypothetical protein
LALKQRRKCQNPLNKFHSGTFKFTRK